MRLKTWTMTVTAAAVSTMILAACSGGGGGGSDSTTATATGSPTVSGTVTGFGSVIIDGVRVDDRGTAAGAETDDDKVVNVELKIGQSVEIQHDGTLKAKQIRVSPELKGAITAIDIASGTMTVLGTTVTINTDAATGPVTVFEAPYSFATATVGDGVEIHGVAKTDAAGKLVIQATRIEKEELGDTYKLRGNVTQLLTGATTFKLGEVTINYGKARVLPTPATLFNGADVTVSIPSTATFTGAAIDVTKVTVKDHREESRGQEAQLRGAVSNILAGAQTFVMNGLTIDASEALFERAASFADLSNGAYVRVKGLYQADGSVKAKSVALRKIEIDEDGEVELHGSILDFVSVADFTVRGMKVDATGVALDDCPSGTVLKNDLQVKVEGMLAADGSLKATEIECEEQEDGASTIEREGVAAVLPGQAMTFVLTGESGITVKWTDTTLFVSPLTEATLDNSEVEVEGVLSAGVLMASKIKLDD